MNGEESRILADDHGGKKGIPNTPLSTGFFQASSWFGVGPSGGTWMDKKRGVPSTAFRSQRLVWV